MKGCPTARHAVIGDISRERDSVGDVHSNDNEGCGNDEAACLLTNLPDLGGHAFTFPITDLAEPQILFASMIFVVHIE